VRRLVLEIDDEADTAGIVLTDGIEQAERPRTKVFANGEVRGRE